MKNKTLVYKSYEDFLNREDKSLNGVSEYFAQELPDFEKYNETNKGCWDCSECVNCIDCTRCIRCEGCKNCYLCMFCGNCYGCDACVGAHDRIYEYGSTSKKK